MCGIAGLIALKNTRVDERRLAAMVDAVSHRGPDDADHVIGGNVGLGHRRLAILDLSPQGRQPMVHPESGRVIVFNGEIYNYVELREELASTGHRFRTGTDTEVILAAYAEWGPDCVRRFNGMWAFAIHDAATRTVFCSRDRFGVKPLYYVDLPECFAFGSEIRQLLPLLDSVRANRSVLIDFVFSGLCDHRPETFFEGVRKVPAAHNLVIRSDTGGQTLQRYYSLDRRPDCGALGIDDAVDRLGQELGRAVRIRLRSDVPVGTCLSGGLDSSSVAALAASRYEPPDGRRFAAITAVSEESHNDESAHARAVAESSALRWLTVKPDYDAFVASLDAVVQAQEEPFGGPSICMQHFVMRTAHEDGLPVLLDGQGGDETLLGYERYFAAHFASVLRARGIRAAWREMRASARHNSLMSPARIAAYLAFFSRAWPRYRVYRHRHRHLRHAPPLPEHLHRYAQASRDAFDLQRLEITELNLPALLRYEDKNSMAYGIETRLPFLDYEFLELALSLPNEHKIHNGWTKYALRLAMQNTLPDSIVWRRDKRGFEAPDKSWLSRHDASIRGEVGRSPLLAEICRTDYLNDRFAGLDMDTRWRLFCCALWERNMNVTA